MDIWELDKLYLFILFVIPGFICLKTYNLIQPSENNDSSKQIVDAITYSCINYALLIIPIIKIEASSLYINTPFFYGLFYFFVLLISPVLLAFLWSCLRETNLFQKNAPHPTSKPWDWLFKQKRHYWVEIVKKNGTILAGKYSSNSFTSSYPADEQIYIEEVWIMNKHGGFKRPVTDTAGAIINSSEISHIEFRTLNN